MDLERLQYSVDNLQVGMYVSALDRPWLETPFLFQGFLIEEPEVIEELRTYCKYVYIDVKRGDGSLIPAEAIDLSLIKEPENPETIQLKEPADDRPKLKLSADETDDDTVRLETELAYARVAHSGAEQTVSDMINKLRAGEAIEITVVEQTLNPMIESIMRNDDAMSWLARMKKKGDYVYDHSLASSIWAMIFGKHLGLDQDDLKALGTGAVFLDVGKTRISDELLVKEALLSSDELKLLRQHVDFGVEIVSKIDGVDPRVIEMVAGHHERYNGTGYPKGLEGSQIPVFARIAGIIDTYDAMTTPRPYADPLSTYDAIRQLNKLAGVEFPEEVVEQFVQAIGVFPVGALVELNSGEVGIVIAQNRVRRLRPKIMLVLDCDKQPLKDFQTIDLRNQLADDAGNNSLWIEKGLAPGEYDLDPSEYYL